MTTTRNKALFDKIANAIENNPERYDQETWSSDSKLNLSEPDGALNRNCGTAFCIAGWAVALHDPALAEEIADDVYGHERWPNYARSFLGIDEHESLILFSGEWYPDAEEDLDSKELAEEVAAALRKIGNGESVVDVTHEDHI